MYRAPDEVFSADSLQSLHSRPDHARSSQGCVNSRELKDLAVGEVSDPGKKDGEWVLLPLILKDAKGIKQVEGGNARAFGWLHLRTRLDARYHR